MNALKYRTAPLLLALAAACGTAETTSLDAQGPVDAGSDDRGATDTGVVDQGSVDLGSADTGMPEDTGSVPDAGEIRDLRDRLLSVDGLDVEEVFAPEPGTRAFLLKLRQPEDHLINPAKTFKQRMVLVHRDVDAPLVMYTTGYSLFGEPERWTEFFLEPTTILDANQLVVEHRYFGESVPREANWQHLDIEQSAHDTHRIIELLSEIYPASWVGTGISKGGMTSIFHHHFFPDDFAAIVPYVAPISFGVGDARYYGWLDQIGPADGVCRNRAKDIAVEAVERRAQLAQYFLQTDPVAARYLPEVLEVAVVLPVGSFHWGFWQRAGSPEGCAALPPRGGPIEDLAAWFPFNPAYFETDFDWDTGPYTYQASHQLGSQGIDRRHLWTVTATINWDLVIGPPVAPPWGDPPMFDGIAMSDVADTLQNSARRVLGIYGAWDPWTGGIITVDEQNDSVVMIAPEIGHAARIADLPEEQQIEAIQRLNAWVGRSSIVANDYAVTRSRLQAQRQGHERIVQDILRFERGADAARLRAGAVPD